MLLKSQSWFCVNRWTDLLLDLSELIEVYLIYAHPNFHSYSYCIQFNIHLFLKSTQKLQKLSCGNTFSFRFRNSRNSNVHLEASPVQSKQKAQEHTCKPEIAAMKTRNFHMTVSRQGTYTHTHTNTHIQAGNSCNENAEFSHGRWSFFMHEKTTKYLVL